MCIFEGWNFAGWQLDEERLQGMGENAIEMVLPDNQRLPKKKRKWYTSQQMQQVMEMAATGLMSIHEVAQRNNVPSTTLHSRVSGQVVHNVNPGPVRYLNVEEENTLATFLF